jgi:hypothetical protein
MTSPELVDAWIRRYVAAWNTNDPAAIGALFTAAASYATEPYARPWRGREQIVQHWLARRDEPGQARFDWQLLGQTNGPAVVTGTTHYPHATYSNLWLVRLDDGGSCVEFTEWWMEHPSAPPEGPAWGSADTQGRASGPMVAAGSRSPGSEATVCPRTADPSRSDR